jgi:hypothetical protein
LTGAIVNPGFFRICCFNWFWAQSQQAFESLGHAEDYSIEGVIQGTQAIHNQATAQAYVERTIKLINGDENAQAT